MTEATNDDARAKSLNKWAFALMALAFTAPFLAAATGYSNARMAGERLVYVLFGLAAFGSVAGIATRKGRPMAKSKARFVVGILLLVGISGSIALEVSDAEAMKTVMRQMFANEARQAQEFVELGKKFDAVSFEKVLTPEALTSSAGLAAAKTLSVRYRALLAERLKLLNTNMAQTEEFILTRSPNDTFRKQVMEGFTGNKAKVSQIYNDLDRVQTAYVDSVDTLLEWCSSQVGKWNVTNGRLMFSSIKQQTELSQLAAKLQAAENAVNATVVNVSAIQTQIQDKRQKAFSEAEKILK